MILNYNFIEDGKEHKYKHKVLRDEIIEFIEDTYNIRQIKDFINFLDKEAYIPEYLKNNDLRDIHDRMDATDLIAKNIAMFHGTPLFDSMKKYFEEDAHNAFEEAKEDDWDIEECLTEALDEPEESDEKDYKKEYIDQYGDTITYADQQVECKILDVTYDPEFGYDVKIENPLYLALDEDEQETADESMRYIWIGDPNAVDDELEEIEFIPTPGVETNARITAEIEENQGNNPTEPDDYLNDNW